MTRPGREQSGGGLPRRRHGRRGVWLLAAMLALAAAPDRPASPTRLPAILVHCARSSADQWGWWVDLRYLRELRTKGFEVDYTDRHEDLTWERLRRYDCLVLYVCPLERGAYYDNTPDRPPYREEFVALIQRFLEAGGGVFLMARAINADESFLPLIERWGARIAHESITESDPRNLAAVPRMPGERLWFTDGVLPGPVSEGVSQVWLPLTPHYAAVETMPIEVSAEWRVVLRGPPSSRTLPVDPERSPLLPPPRALAREGGVREPDLFAVREYRGGRIAFCSVWPQYSIGQGTRWLYERRVLSEGVEGRRSDFGRLIENTLRWLSAPGLATHPGRRFVTDPDRLVEPNLRPGARERFLALSRRHWPGEGRQPSGARAPEPLLRGLIGAQTRLGSGSGTVERYARAARRAGLDFVVFLEDARKLDGPKLAALARACARHSGEDLRLLPGYWIETNTGNRIFLFGPGVELPPAQLLDGERLNQQYRDPRTGRYETRGVFVDWINYRLIAGGQVNIGYFGFGDRPRGQPISDLRFCSVVALRLFRDGRAVEDNLDGYLTAAAGTLPPAPLAVHLLTTPGALARAARREVGLTFVGASAPGEVWSELSYAGQYAAPNIFTSDGPLIEAWPDVYQYYTFGAEEFVARAARVPSPLVVRSEVGLDEVRIYDGDRLYRRFTAHGAKRLEKVLELDASVQRTLVVVAEDVRGGRAVSNARRLWKGGGLAPVFCGDRVNHCDGAPLLAKGPGIVQVSRTPPVEVGATWDGGPRGEWPILSLRDAERPLLISDAGTEGAHGFHNLPLLETADEGVVRVRSVLDRLYDERVPVVNPWHTYGPLDGPTQLFRTETTLTEFARPSAGPHPYRYPGFATRTGATVSLYEARITFRRDQRVDSLRLFDQRPYDGPFPVTLVHGRGGDVLHVYELEPGRASVTGPVLEKGDWIGVHGPPPANPSLHLNRGDALRLDLGRGPRLAIGFYADLEDVSVRAGEHRDFALLSVVDPIDVARRDTARIRRVARYLLRPDGVEIRRGRPRDSAAGLIELEADGGTVALRVGRPDPPLGVPLPVRVFGLEPRWSAGLLLRRGRRAGELGPWLYRDLGFDRDGRVYATLFPGLAEVTEAVVGHPVTCDRAELIVHVVRKNEGDGPEAWHVAVNNPTDHDLRATLRVAMPLRGLLVDGRIVDVPAGGHVVLQ